MWLAVTVIMCCILFIMQTDRTPLHAAAASGHVQVIKFLCDRGANLNAGDRVSVHVHLFE